QPHPQLGSGVDLGLGHPQARHQRLPVIAAPGPPQRRSQRQGHQPAGRVHGTTSMLILRSPVAPPEAAATLPITSPSTTAAAPEPMAMTPHRGNPRRLGSSSHGPN